MPNPAPKLELNKFNTRSAVEDLKPLTSFRFFAAFAIVVLHAKLYMNWGWVQSIRLPLVQGVSFFFVLSGFILTHVYHGRHDIGYWGFLRLRIARLWPTHLATLALVVLFIRPATFGGTGWFDYRLTALANVTLLQSWIPFSSYFFAWNSVSWSISTEMGFYLCFPLILRRIDRSWWLILSLSALVVIATYGGLRLAGLPENSADVNRLTVGSATYAEPSARCFEFCLGMVTWVLWDRYLRHLKLRAIFCTLVELAVLIAAGTWLAVFFHRAQAEVPAGSGGWFGEAGSCWAFAILIAAFAEGRGVLGRLLSTRLMVWLGEISFAIYMVHQILFKIATRHPAIQSEAAFLSALIAVAAMLHYVVERPGRALLSGRFSWRRPKRGPIEVMEAAPVKRKAVHNYYKKR
jgi:peptidoglycan/LPS O-acetylase OafA/YrhL